MISIKALIVEDDAAIIKALSELIEAEGFQIVVERTQEGACKRLDTETFDIALLDITLAQGNGFAVCATAQTVAPNMPVIFLTASDDEYSTVAGLEMGAADYIAKPFRARELIARIHIALRHAENTEPVISAGDIHIDMNAGTTMKDNQELYLSALEYRLLLYFLQHKGKLVTREMLRDAIWDSAGEYVSDNALNVYIKRLREKIEDDPSEPNIIVTVRGMGYKVGM